MYIYIYVIEIWRLWVNIFEFMLNNSHLCRNYIYIMSKFDKLYDVLSNIDILLLFRQKSETHRCLMFLICPIQIKKIPIIRWCHMYHIGCVFGTFP